MWNAYNRIRTRFEVVSEPSAAERVVNPHLTWHAPNYFHFKRHDQQSEDASFWGVADITLMIQQQLEVKWIRAVSGPLSGLKTACPLRGRFNSEDLTIQVPTENLSVQITVDFIRPNAGAGFAVVHPVAECRNLSAPAKRNKGRSMSDHRDLSEGLIPTAAEAEKKPRRNA